MLYSKKYSHGTCTSIMCTQNSKLWNLNTWLEKNEWLTALYCYFQPLTVFKAPSGSLSASVSRVASYIKCRLGGKECVTTSYALCITTAKESTWLLSWCWHDNSLPITAAHVDTAGPHHHFSETWHIWRLREYNWLLLQIFLLDLVHGFSHKFAPVDILCCTLCDCICLSVC